MKMQASVYDGCSVDVNVLLEYGNYKNFDQCWC